MPVDSLLVRKAVVLGSAFFYWGGVLLQVYRVGKRIGRSPNVRPRGLKESLLWFSWLIVIVGWFGQPFLLGGERHAFFRPLSFLLIPSVLFGGVVLALGGLIGTWWCYAALGDAWRLGIRKREKTILVKSGPYRRVRHPLYLFQSVIIAGCTLLLPTPLMILLTGIHAISVFIKALDEEAYLGRVHGEAYRDYLLETGRFLPRVRSQRYQETGRTGSRR